MLDESNIIFGFLNSREPWKSLCMQVLYLARGKMQVRHSEQEVNESGNPLYKELNKTFD